MNNYFKITGMLALLSAVVFLGVTAAFAQGPNQANNGARQPMNQGQAGPRGAMNLMAVSEDDMHAAIAEALGMSVVDFEAAIAAGETPATLAAELGIDFAVVQAAMDALHAEALQQAVADGLITQEQADWMLSRQGGQNGQMGNGAQGNGTQQGTGFQGNGAQGNQMNRGANQGRHGGNGSNSGHQGDCLYQNS